MKKVLLLIILFSAFIGISAQNIQIQTKGVDLIFKVGADDRLFQSYIGKSLKYESDIAYLDNGIEAYSTHGMKDYFEPAIRVLHNDGNPSLLLTYVSHQEKQLSPGVNQTIIILSDKVYPVTVKLYFTAYVNEDVITTFTEIQHKQKKPITLYNYASSMLNLKRPNYYLTDFTGDWANEANMNETHLTFGKRVLDTKLGSRSNMFCTPMFIISSQEQVSEDHGEVLFGTLAWSGNFRFTFEVDNTNRLRIISGINPYASEYTLKPNEVFKTPEFIFTYSSEGKGKASRNLHNWARNYQLKDGKGKRLTLLNNWEATYFDFNEEKLASIIADAGKLGVDMFLLDDGWFGKKYPRNSDKQGLGDWVEIKDKLPNGIGKLIQISSENGVKFGLWIEPEMVNPKSELYEKHKDWVIHLPNRKEYYFRNQMVLDLSNPKVQDYVFSVVDDLMTKHPGIAFFKWDCNSPITNIYSSYLEDKQSHLYVEYVKGLYNVLDRVAEKYPSLPMMLCAGGGGRTDYKALEYFTEFWPSDNTNPVERIFIQWGYSHFFPSKSLSAHVTSWNKNTSIKFRTDVAMMGKLGFDVMFNELTKDEQTFCIEAVQLYNHLSPTILDGELYRLYSPYVGDYSSSIYVSKDKSHAVLFAFDMYPRYAEDLPLVKIQGLEADKMYYVNEVNLPPNKPSSLRFNGKLFSGDYLMNVGLNIFTGRHTHSRVIELTQK